MCLNENDKIMIMGPINYGKDFKKSNRTCSVSLVAILN